MELKVFLDENAKMPTKAHSTDAGFDIYAPERIVVHKNSYAFIDSGVHILIPEGYVGMIKSKSGLNKNNCILCEGVVDAGYTGSIGLKIYNHSNSEMKVFEKGDKVTQIVIMPIPEVELTQVNDFNEFDDTERGSNGFGSTGTN